MSEFLIYGKIIKDHYFNNKLRKSQKMFKALNYNGVRVSRLTDADTYASKEDAQEVINKAKKNLSRFGIEDCIEFQIRKAK